MEKSIVNNLSLEKELKVVQSNVAEMEAKLKKKKKKLRSSELLIKESLQKSDKVVAQRMVAEKRASLVEERAH